MTDLVNGMNQGQEVSQVPAAEMASASEQRVAADERVFKQSEVNDIIKKAKYGAVEDYKRLQAQQPQYAQEKYSDNSSLRHSEAMPEDKLKKLVEEAAERHIDRVRQDALEKHQEEMAQRVVQNFYQKTQSGKEKFQDFDTVTGDIPLQHFPKVVELLADHVENADEVYYELGKDLLKMSGIENLARESMPAAVKEMKRFAKSLKDNEDARRIRQPNEPLSQMRPSNTGTDVGAMSVSDYRKKYKV